MRKVLFILMLLMSALPVTAERGIVLNESNYVLYKFDTELLPELLPGEYIIFAPNIDDVQKDARYYDSIFHNPIPLPPDMTINDLKQNYTQAMVDLDTIRNTANPTEAQQTWAIKREAAILDLILRFLKAAFFD